MKIFMMGFLFLSLSAFAGDEGFRYMGGKCLNKAGKEGLNPGYLGQCADLRRVVIGRLNLNGTDFSGADFSDSDFRFSTFEKTKLDGAKFDGTELSSVSFLEAKMVGGSFKRATLKGATLSSVEMNGVDFSGAGLTEADLRFGAFLKSNFTGANLSTSKLGEANFTGSDCTTANFAAADMAATSLNQTKLDGANFSTANLSDAYFQKATGKGTIFNDTILRKADFTGANFAGCDFRKARVEYTIFVGTDLRETNLGGTVFVEPVLKDVKLKGAKFSKRTQLPFSMEEALSQGMVIPPSKTVLVIWDKKDGVTVDFVKALEELGAEITLTAATESAYAAAGAEAPVNFDAVIHLNGTTYNNDMPEAGQKALVDYVMGGGTFIHGEWNSYELLEQGRMKLMRELTLFDRAGLNKGKVALKMMDGQGAHPVLSGIADNTMIDVAMSEGKMHVFATEPATLLMKTARGMDFLAVRKFGKGRIVGLEASGNYDDYVTLKDPTIQQIYFNAISWTD